MKTPSTKARRRLLAGALALFPLAVACDDDTTLEPPLPGTLQVVLSTPNPSEGALILELTGPGLGSLAPTSSGVELFHRATPSGEAAVLVGNVAPGPILTFHVPDIREAVAYQARLDQVAGPDGALRTLAPDHGLAIQVRR